MKQQFGALSAKWRAIGAGTRIMIVMAVLGLSIAGYVVYTQATQTKWAVLFANVDDKTASDVLANLDKRGIPHELSGNGTRILVPADQLETTRVALAGDGVTGQAVPKGFDEVFANQGLASSDFEQRVNYQRALEGELARTLLAMQPVAGASVKLSIPEQSIFIGDGSSTTQQATASVMLSLRRDLTRPEIQTVANLVASSVEGLTPDQVTIASADGTLLQAAGSDATGAGSSASAMDATQAYETELSDRLSKLAQTLTGQSGARVEVRAVLDFTQSTVDKEEIDPTKNTPVAEHDANETWTGSGSQVGGSTGVDGGPISSTGSGDGTYSKTDKTTTYTPGDRTVTHSIVNTPKVTRLSIAVVVPVVAGATGSTGDATTAAGGSATPTTISASSTVKAVDATTLSRVLGSAAGIDATRGDTIEVAMVPAVATDSGALITEPTVPTAAPKVPQTTMVAEAAGAGAFAMLLLAMMMRRRRKKKEKRLAAMSGDAKLGKRARKKLAKQGGGASAGGAPATSMMPATASRSSDPDRDAVDEIKGDLERMLAESPESLAALLSSWMAK